MNYRIWNENLVMTLSNSYFIFNRLPFQPDEVILNFITYSGDNNPVALPYTMLSLSSDMVDEPYLVTFPNAVFFSILNNRFSINKNLTSSTTVTFKILTNNVYYTINNGSLAINLEFRKYINNNNINGN